MQYPSPPPSWTARLWRSLPPRLRGERDVLFWSFTLFLGLGYLAFGLTSLLVGFGLGVVANLLGGLSMGALAWLRWRGWPLRPLVSAMQMLVLVQALWIAWMTGGIYSPALGWLALAPLPALLADNRRSRLLGVAASFVAIAALYGFALLGGEAQLDIAPDQLIHWHLVMALVIFGLQLAMLQRLHSMRQRRLQRMHRRAATLRQLHQQLKRTQQQKDLFVASVSHELRTPMNAILGLADLIQHDRQLSADVRAKVEDIQKSGEHLLTIVNDLLDHAQMEAGRLQVVSEAYDLHEALRTGHQLLRRRAESKPLDYRLELAPDVPQWVMGDSHRLVQILVNLLGNALKFTDRGEIVLECSCSPDRIWLEVRDTGMGIPSERQGAIFETFSQADASIAGRFGGNGLGLAITRGLVEAMGGQIDFESQVGQGTRFFLWLPLRPAAPPQRMSSASREDEPPSEDSLCILVADDNPLNRQIASLQLRRHWPQARVIEATNGVEALHQLQAHGADVVLMDLLMPEMDGLEAVRCIRRDLPEPLRSVPVIALTANNDPAEWERCMDAGMNACMLKPFDRQKLIRTLQDLLG